MYYLLDFISRLLQLYSYVLLASIVFSWLYAFNVINSGNPIVDNVGRFLYYVTEPVLRPIRRFLPNFGGLDLSPVVVFIGIYFIQAVVIPNIYHALT